MLLTDGYRHGNRLRHSSRLLMARSVVQADARQHTTVNTVCIIRCYRALWPMLLLCSTTIVSENHNKCQSNPAVGGSASFPFARCSAQQFPVACFDCGLRPQNHLFPLETRNPHVTKCVTGPHTCTA